MDNAQHIRRASRRLKRLFTVIMVLIPVINALIWLDMNQLPAEMQKAILPDYAQVPLPFTARLMSFGVSLLPASVAMYGVLVLVRLFKLYEEGHIFRAANVRCFRNLSRTLAAWCAASVVSGPLLSVALTLHHPPGQRMIVVDLESPDLTALLVGLVLAVVAWVMEEGRKLQEEQDYTV